MVNDMLKEIESYFSNLVEVIRNVDSKEIEKFINLLLEARDEGRRIFIFGNGGSATTASHFAADLNKGASFHREVRFKVIPLTDNLATILAYANDVSYEDIFVEQMKNFFEEGDLVIGISGSGNSANVLKTIDYANDSGGITFGITGYDGGELRKRSKYSFNVNFNDMQISEDLHMILCHVTMKMCCRQSIK